MYCFWSFFEDFWDIKSLFLDCFLLALWPIVYKLTMKEIKRSVILFGNLGNYLFIHIWESKFI